jgi:hypothetical protein
MHDLASPDTLQAINLQPVWLAYRDKNGAARCIWQAGCAPATVHVSSLRPTDTADEHRLEIIIHSVDGFVIDQSSTIRLPANESMAFMEEATHGEKFPVYMVVPANDNELLIIGIRINGVICPL